MILHDRILPYLDHANLLHVARLNDYWFKLDEPVISAFVERWLMHKHLRCLFLVNLHLNC
ncbi:hypothetical protein AHAS_Ahas06G0145800 [Arachis hypogaea]